MKAIRYSLALGAANPDAELTVDPECPSRYVCVPLYVYMGIVHDLHAFMDWAVAVKAACGESQ